MNTIFSTIAGKVNLLPLRAITFLEWENPRGESPINSYTFMRIESNSKYQLVERQVPHSKKFFTTIGYSFTADVYLPFNDFDKEEILECLDNLIFSNEHLKDGNTYRTTFSVIFTLGDATPPGCDEGEDFLPQIVNSTSGYFINLEYCNFSYKITDGGFRPILNLKFQGEIKSRKWYVESLHYAYPSRVFMEKEEEEFIGYR